MTLIQATWIPASSSLVDGRHFSCLQPEWPNAQGEECLGTGKHDKRHLDHQVLGKGHGLCLWESGQREALPISYSPSRALFGRQLLTYLGVSDGCWMVEQLITFA